MLGVVLGMDDVSKASMSLFSCRAKLWWKDIPSKDIQYRASVLRNSLAKWRERKKATLEKGGKEMWPENLVGATRALQTTVRTLEFILLQREVIGGF